GALVQRATARGALSHGGLTSPSYREPGFWPAGLDFEPARGRSSGTAGVLSGLLQQARDHLFQNRPVHRLGDVAVESGLLRTLLVAPHGHCGDRDQECRCERLIRLQFACCREPILSRHREVEEDERWPLAPRDLDALISVRREENAIALALQHGPQQLAVGVVIVDHQHLRYSWVR